MGAVLLDVGAQCRLGICGGLIAAALGCCAPASAATDPMLAGAAFARSDLSPLSGVTLLRFVPGYGLQRGPVDQPLTDPRDAAPPPILETEARPADWRQGHPMPGRSDPQALANKPISAAVRDAVSQVIALRAPNTKRIYVFVATGDRQLGFNLGPTAGWGFSPEGLSLEHSEVRSVLRTGLGWQDGPYTALISFTQYKPRVVVPWLPAVQNELIGLTLIHSDR